MQQRPTGRRHVRVGPIVFVATAAALCLASAASASAAGAGHAPSPGTPTPQVSSVPGQLVATAAVTSTDVWSVGGTDQPGESDGKTLIEHWDGHAWSRVKSPNSPGSIVSSLDSVSAVSANDIWASGTGARANGAVDSLIEHWDGSTWTAVEAPNNPASDVNYLQAVSADSTNDAWVAADYLNPEGVWIPFAEHWNGHAWSIVSVPQPKGSLQTFLTGVVSLSTKDAWVVGQQIDGAGAPVSVAEHWNGTRWSVVATPNPSGVQSSGLSAAAATTSTDVWADGNTTLGSGRTRTLVEHWDGHAWSVVRSPTPKGGLGSTLDAISADATGDAWAAGESQSTNGDEHTLTLRWNGIAWTTVPSPDVKGAQATALNGVSATSPADAWATGSSYTASGAATTLNLHWNGSRWTIAP